MQKKPIIIISVLCVISLALGYLFGLNDEESLSNGDAETNLKKEPEFLREGLVAYYPFNGNAKDESGNGHDGKVEGATSTTDRFGNASKAYSFDGIDDSIVSNDILNVPLDSFTYSIWVQPDAYKVGETWETIVSRTVVPVDKKNLNWFGMTPHHENPRSLRLHASRTDWIDSRQGVVTFNQWSHFIGTYDGTTAKIYLNGQLVAEGATSPAPPSTSYKFSIGRDYSINPEFLSGLVDDLRIYHRALSAEEVKALYEFEKAE